MTYNEFPPKSEKDRQFVDDLVLLYITQLGKNDRLYDQLWTEHGKDITVEGDILIEDLYGQLSEVDQNLDQIRVLLQTTKIKY